MKPIIPFSRHFLTSKRLLPELTQLINNPPLVDNFCCTLLDQYPGLKTLKKLHSKILVDQCLHSNPNITIKLMRAYAARGETGHTRHLFDEFTEKNVIFYNVMIRSYNNNYLNFDALVLFRSMLGNGIGPDHYTYPCVLKACSMCGDLRVGLQIHAAVVKVGYDLNLFVGNGLIAMYGKCGCLVKARTVLDGMMSRDIVSWNSLVAGYAQNGKFEYALEVCREMEFSTLRNDKFKPDAGTMASLMPAVTNTSPDNVLYVKEMFMNLEEKTLVSWNVMISVYVNNSMPAEAVELYNQMERKCIEPDSFSIASILPACGDVSALLLGRKIHQCVKRKKLSPNLLLENALIDMYAKCGSLNDARGVFDQMKFRDVVSWTSMISAYGISGRGNDAVELFSKMRNSGLIPDSIAFVSILSACSHAGLLDEGRYYFKLMTERYKLTPRIEHHSCMVDLLGRAGKLEEAYEFIMQMPMVPNERVWGALLGACHVYSNTDVGLVAADNLFRLVPDQSGYYVLLSNIYAKAGLWKNVAEVRMIMKSKGLKKLPGASNVEVKDKVYTFLVGDTYHPQWKKIYEELDVLVGKMKEAGYVPETGSALHDVEEEEKECHLAVHSEKLAIVFAMLNTEPGTPIRITKNLRICGDCHIAVKLISKIAKREIIVRDTNRFHHFQDGVCSCADYW